MRLFLKTWLRGQDLYIVDVESCLLPSQSRSQPVYMLLKRARFYHALYFLRYKIIFLFLFGGVGKIVIKEILFFFMSQAIEIIHLFIDAR